MSPEAKVGSLYKYRFNSFVETPEPFAVMDFDGGRSFGSSKLLNKIYEDFKNQTLFLLVDKWSDEKYDYYKILFRDRFVELGLTKPRKWSSSFVDATSFENNL